MGWFSPATHLSPQAVTVLTELATSGSSEYAGVADTLNTIAENGEDSASDAYLLTCAEQMHEAAMRVIQALRPVAVSKVEPTMQESQLCCPTCPGHVALTYMEAIENTRQQLNIADAAVYFEARYTTEGFDDGQESYLYCSECAEKFRVPDGLAITFV